VTRGLLHAAAESRAPFPSQAQGFDLTFQQFPIFHTFLGFSCDFRDFRVFLGLSYNFRDSCDSYDFRNFRTFLSTLY
jgi:hypothetical protein